MRTIRRNLERGAVQSIEMEILYPDGTVLETKLDPGDGKIGLLILTDAMVKRVAASGQHQIDLDAWQETGKEWRDRPTFISIGAASSGKGAPYCDCCLHKHYVDIYDKSRPVTISEPTKGAPAPGGDRGVVRKLTIEVAYPNGQRARTTYHPEEDRTALIAFDDGLVESCVAPLVAKEHAPLIDEWDKAGGDWRARPSILVLSEPQRGFGGMDANFDCCFYYHRSNDMLVNR